MIPPASGELPPDPFIQAPNPDAVFFELRGGAPGPAAELAAAASGALAKHFRYVVPPSGDLHLRAPDDTQVEIIERATHSSGLATEADTTQGPSLVRLAGKGLANWLTGTFQGESRQHTVHIIGADGQQTTIETRSNDSHIAVGAWAHTATPEGLAPVAIADAMAVEALLPPTAEMIRRSKPVDPQLIIAERQAGPCERVIGAEAVGVQRTALRLLSEKSRKRPGNPHDKGERYGYEPVTPDPSQGWPVRGVEVIRRPAGWKSTLGVEGRIVMTYTQFTRTPPSEAAQYPESELVVRTQGVFGPDNMLIGAEVSYFITQPEGGHRAVALDKKQRETVHEAMGRQLSSDPIKMRRLY